MLCTNGQKRVIMGVRPNGRTPQFVDDRLVALETEDRTRGMRLDRKKGAEMASDSEQAVAIGNGHGPDIPLAVRPVENARRLDALAPLIHQLITWEIVTQTESGTFVLQDDVQQRLQELSAAQSHSTAAVYVGRMCGRCGVVGVTRLIDGELLCSSCNVPTIVEASTEPPAATSHRRSRWHRKAG